MQDFNTLCYYFPIIENNYIALIPKSNDSCIEFKPLQNPMCIQLLVLVLQFLHVLH